MAFYSDNWVVYVALIYLAINKLLQYTISHHKQWKSKLPFPNVRVSRQRFLEKRHEIRKLQIENRLISAQDNYAQWTKNNRKLTKLEKELSSIKEELTKAVAKNDKLLGTLKLVVLTLPFLALKLLKGKHIVYHLPKSDVFPQLMSGVWTKGWLYLGLAPLQMLRGRSMSAVSITEVGVSLGIWLWALQRVVDTIEFLIKQLFLESAVTRPEPKVQEVHEINSDKIELD
ncbi:hypothetical protein HG535_0E04030 [Zygotorulaspora mrakii]|uniref:Golgi to ER traffic protein 1 n=1 Tax=Zygotorulaspora mrakii TaxID=42260 RepID=A0A7H9B5S9_ZYGMR|nr:uncharacterized protein HG535_0E04030 [Zygotorulaspora mrakii]QLG73319.1 hypothetical protein HG535_0E04030 [Zygotorulaspora mrakii]